MYQALHSWRSDFVPLRNLTYHVQVWGEPTPGMPPLVLLHGWMDVAASFQFVVDALRPGTWAIAPDWRGFGQTAAPAADCFWFPDYLADLDCLLDHYAPQGQVHLVGHSMGGNIAMLYAGVRPQRVRRLINLEGFGMPATQAAQAPVRFGQWLDQLRQLREGSMEMRDFDGLEAVARRLIKTNPRLRPPQARWLAQHWARQESPGKWRIQGHPAHRITGAQLYRLDEVLEVHRCITAPTLVVQAAEDSMAQWWPDSYSPAEFRQRLEVIRTLETARIEDAGHMLHHDQPQAVAALIEGFIR